MGLAASAAYGPAGADPVQDCPLAGSGNDAFFSRKLFISSVIGGLSIRGWSARGFATALYFPTSPWIPELTAKPLDKRPQFRRLIACGIVQPELEGMRLELRQNLDRFGGSMAGLSAALKS